jgi:hypothetical protein
LAIADISLPLFANDKYVINILDLELYENMPVKPALKPSVLKHLEEGGSVVCFYSVKQNAYNL